MFLLSEYIGLRLGRCVREKIFRVGTIVALPNAFATAMFKLYGDSTGLLWLEIDQTAFSTFAGLIGLFIAFRASQAYARFWEGASSSFQMMSEFFDAASSVIAFCRNSKVCTTKVEEFQHRLVRLFSIMHALVLAEISSEGAIHGTEAAFGYDLIDPEALDSRTWLDLAGSDSPVDLVFQWIQGLLVDGQHEGIICVPPPICTRAFQELNSGMLQFTNAIKITEVPFPFPYTASTELILILHWFLVPLVAYRWADSVVMCCTLSFVQVFTLWALSCIAVELENPFGGDINDLDAKSNHEIFNRRLLLLLEPSARRVPELSVLCDAQAVAGEEEGQSALLLRAKSILSLPSGSSPSPSDGRQTLRAVYKAANTQDLSEPWQSRRRLSSRNRLGASQPGLLPPGRASRASDNVARQAKVSFALAGAQRHAERELGLEVAARGSSGIDDDGAAAAAGLGGGADSSNGDSAGGTDGGGPLGGGGSGADGRVVIALADAAAALAAVRCAAPALASAGAGAGHGPAASARPSISLPSDIEENVADTPRNASRILVCQPGPVTRAKTRRDTDSGDGIGGGADRFGTDLVAFPSGGIGGTGL